MRGETKLQRVASQQTNGLSIGIKPSILFTSLVGLFLSLILFTTTAHAQFSVCNRSPFPVETAVTHLEHGAWKTEGWWKIWPNRCKTLISSPVTNRYLYLYADSPDHFFVWRGNTQFCVSDNPFTTFNDRCTNPSEYKREFFLVDNHGHSNSQSQLVCRKCNLPTARFDSSSMALSTFTMLYTRVRGIDIPVPLSASIRFHFHQNDISADVNIVADLGALQNNVSLLVGKALDKSISCGDEVSMGRSTLMANGRGGAVLHVSGTYRKWVCTYMTLPQIKCVHVFDCHIWSGSVRTSNNAIITQSGNASILLAPAIAGTYSVYASAKVLYVHLDGLAGIIANLFHINVRGIAQQSINKLLSQEQLRYAIPVNLRKHVRLNRVAFEGNGPNDLTLKADGTMAVSMKDLGRLCLDRRLNALCRYTR